MDERLWLFFNDVDWALRIRSAGYRIWYLDEARVTHHLGGSTRHYADFGAEWHRNRIHYYGKHHGVLGRFLAKSALAWVAVRQCWRIRKDLPDWRPWLQQSGVMLKTAAKILSR